MTETIQNMKKHTCPTCGGQLRINVERQMYECPFCGVSFDYEYFREDDVLELAARSLKAGEYLSANSAYDFMLTKEPHNFLALRGKILVAANAKSMSEFKQPNYLRTLAYGRIDPAADAALENAKTEHKGYFSKLKELFDLGKEYKEAIARIDESKKERNEKSKEIQALSAQGADPYVELPDPIIKDETISVHPKTIIKGVIVIFVIWCIILACIASVLSTNPYAKPSETTATTTTTRINHVYVPGEGVISVDSGNSFRSIGDYYNEERKESQRIKQAEQWDRDHANDKQVFLGLVILPAIVGAIIIIAMVARLHEIEKCEEAIGRVIEKQDKIDETTHSYETTAAEIRAKIGTVFRELTALDPFPEVEKEEPKGKVLEWGKWK